MSTKTMYCESCGAVGESCCAAAKARQETASLMGNIVQRQSVRITQLTRELAEARQVAAELRAQKKKLTKTSF